MSNHDLNPHMLQLCWMSFQLHVLGLFSITVSPNMLAQKVAKEGKPEKWASFLEEKRMIQTLFHGIISQFLSCLESMRVHMVRVQRNMMVLFSIHTMVKTTSTNKFENTQIVCVYR